MIYCPNCFALVANDVNVCPKCNCTVKTEGCLTQEVMNAEIAFLKQGFGFKKYSIYKNREHLNQTYEENEKHDHEYVLKYLTPTCIAVSFGILIFGLDDLTIINAIIATVLGYVASVILRKILDKSHSDEVKSHFITENEKDTLLSSQYETNVLKPLENDILSKVLSLYPNIQISYSLNLRTDISVILGQKIDRRAIIIWELFKEKHEQWATLEEYAHKIFEICRNDILKLCIEKLIKEVAENKSALMTRAELYYRELYSVDLNVLLSSVEGFSYSDDRTENELQRIQSMKETIDNAMTLLKEEQEKIEPYFSKQSTIKNAFEIIKKKTPHLLYFSEKFQKHFHIVESVALISLKTKISFENLKDKIDKAEYSLGELQSSFDSEQVTANELFEQQKKFADELTKKLETVLLENNDVKYSYEVDTMTSEIRKLISAYENGPQALNPDHVNDRIKMLIKIRKHERKEILDTIRSYEKQLQKLHEMGKVYERPNAGVIADKFLERIKNR